MSALLNRAGLIVLIVALLAVPPVLAAFNAGFWTNIITEILIWSLLADHGRGRGEGEEGNASRLHASILMAGKFSEAV